MTSVYVKGFIPVDITDSRFISSTIAEPAGAEPAWSSGATYAEFDQVSSITTDSHLVYESLQSGNLNHSPAASPTWWILKSYTNRFRMFEWNRGSPSVGTSPLTTVIRPGQRINSVFLDGMKVATAELTVQDGLNGPVIFSVTKDLLARHATTPYEIAFAPWIYDKVYANFDIPPISDPVISVTLTDPSGTCELSRLSVGMSVDLGEVDWGTAREDENYSTISYEAGKANFAPVPNIPVLELPIVIDTIRVNRARQFKDLANGKAVVWSAMTNIDGLQDMHSLIGPYQRFRFETLNHRETKIDLTIKGI